MSNDIRILTSFLTHPKAIKLEHRLGLVARWNLIRLFLFARDNRSDGLLHGMTIEDIEIAADWRGEPYAFVDAILEIGFLDQTEDGYSIHGWSENNPWAAGASYRTKIARDNAMRKWYGEGGADVASSPSTRAQRLSEARKKGMHDASEWEALKVVCGTSCLQCGAHGVDLVKDHIKPIFMGGSDGIDNIQPLCRTCNRSKGSKSVDYRPAGWQERLQKCLQERLQNVCEMTAKTSANGQNITKIEVHKNVCKTSSKRPFSGENQDDVCKTSAESKKTSAESQKTSAESQKTSAPSPSPKALKAKACQKQPLALERFAEFWLIYPRKDSRVNAERAWSKLGCDAIADTVIAGAKRYAAEKAGTEKQFIAMPTTWLNGQRWEDAGTDTSAQERTGARKNLPSWMTDVGIVV